MSLINITLIVYVIAFIAYIVREIWRSTATKWVSLGLLILAFCFNLAMVAKRSIEAGHPPFSNLYESLIFMHVVRPLCILYLNLFIILGS